MKVLITGGAGFIGSHLAAALAGKAEVRVLDDFTTGSHRNLAGVNVRVLEGSVLDRVAVRAAVTGVDCVFHLAAFVSVPESVQDPGRCTRLNVDGTRAVLEEAATAGVRRLIFSSSAAVYGDTAENPKVETMRLAPGSPYATSKLAGERLCREFAQGGRLETVSLRFFNVFGPRQTVGNGYAAVVPIFIQQAMANEPLSICGDGLQTRDFIFVTEVAAALWHAAMTPGLSGEFNVGSGRATTVRELAERIIGLTRSRSSIVHVAERPGDVRHSRADIEAFAAAGFRPIGSLDAGLLATCDFARGVNTQVRL